ncbi:hypothetical protein HaLaN_27444 [Haematococcus lacustris]|uniref:Uncharacterized protein n=1 Tax=Haematococcus lacustris TaxID=44745 RepID=A0A6A0A8W1_HAELA|nr:hypothetical protein HaLaN_27444 [Haematococcus lacustris]
MAHGDNSEWPAPCTSVAPIAQPYREHAPCLMVELLPIALLPLPPYLPRLTLQPSLPRLTFPTPRSSPWRSSQELGAMGQ